MVLHQMMEYIFCKEVIDNSIDEFVMGNGKTIEVSVKSMSFRKRLW